MTKSPGYHIILLILAGCLAWTTYQVKSAELRKSASSSGGRGQPAPTASMVGQKAPDFTLKSLDGHNVSLSEFAGRDVVLVCFWDSWHPTAKAAMMAFASFERKYGDKGLKVIAVNRGEPQATVAEFVKEAKYASPVLLDETGSVAAKYGVEAVPTLVLVDKKGEVRSFKEGLEFVASGDLENEICRQLGVKRSVNDVRGGARTYERG